MQLTPIFKNIGPQSDNKCGVCLLDRTNMCPRRFTSGPHPMKKPTFVGRYMHDPDEYYNVSKCHRFILTPAERHLRNQRLLRKLKANL